ncbi:uncharacterized protein [Epargyreus clarus]|uniref:uncharacterized protein n=1 Tax=Epargyreus clarus TaxID=520877 RepID=UPI003C2C369F
MKASNNILRMLLAEENYDSVSNFLTMAEHYMMIGGPLHDFFNRYQPSLRENRNTCVGLAFQLMLRLHDLDRWFPEYASSFALASCEENISDVERYVIDGPGPASVIRTEKEHVVICAKVYIDGRYGVILADPGYHIAHFVTIMADRNYPHSGWHLQMFDFDFYKQIQYVLSPANPNYLEWHELKTRDGRTDKEVALIYYAQPFLSAIPVTEKRNLVYKLKSVLARDFEGKVRAGLFFRVLPTNSHFTIMVDYDGLPIRTKVDFDFFLFPEFLPADLLLDISRCNRQLGFAEGELFDMLCRLARLLANEPFVSEMLHIDSYIKTYCGFRPRYYHDKDIV